MSADKGGSMKRSLVASACVAGCALASAAAADEPWFKLLEAKDGGYIATGKLHGTTSRTWS